ncbi:MAG: sugar ABC transporter ATP-binding protein [Spirochaetaceae bacterium]|nr:sugar ABC transporter ATP-binding protein [Spirochaetaceae bacterium]
MNDKGKPGVPAFVMRQVSKVYPGTIAVDKVDFDIHPGEVHALIGENGAGKSTLMKMMAGSFDDYTGEIQVNGEIVQLHSPAVAKRHGIEMIYQELSLAMPISIAENVLVGRLPKKGAFIDRTRMNIETTECLEKVGLQHLDPATPVEDISQHEAQLIEIAKALGNDPTILVMDEPTSALSRSEVDRLFEIIGNLKTMGLAIVYISHHLPEIFQVADRVTVLRDGKLIDTQPIGEVTRELLVHMMVGQSVADFACADFDGSTERLRVENLTRKGFFHDISFHAYKGEVLGIGGLSGAGRSELARVLVGLDRRDSGRIFLDGRQIRFSNMAQALDQGIAYLTENRKSEGLAIRLDVRDNILAGLIPRLTKYGVYDEKRGMPILTKLIRELSIYPPDPLRTVANLSGGNQQKVLLAKWMACDPKVLILDEPTRGVDIGAKLIIHQSIERLAAEGLTVILISSDLPELVALSNRVMIMRQGHFIREMVKTECSEESILLAANGEGLES